HLTAAARLRLPRPRPSPAASSRWGYPRGAYLDWRPLRRCDRMRRFSVDEGGGGGEDGEKRDEEEAAAPVEAKVGAAEELGSERSRSGSFSSSSSPSSAVRGVKLLAILCAQHSWTEQLADLGVFY
uniref:Uncharacterized protein n=1 Tax=Aegilops tauschii subsp. strangulata TaxID=200361 RepID=A0A453M101_AEGTS